MSGYNLTMTENQKIARKIIADNLYLSLATVGMGQPWIAPLYYAADENFNLYFVSEKTSRHAQHITRSPQVAVSIFNSQEIPEKVNGVQIKGEARQVGLKELPHALGVYFKKRFSELLTDRIKDHLNPIKYLGGFPYRVYKIIPHKTYILDPQITKQDIRVEVKL